MNRFLAGIALILLYYSLYVGSIKASPLQSDDPLILDGWEFTWFPRDANIPEHIADTDSFDWQDIAMPLEPKKREVNSRFVLRTRLPTAMSLMHEPTIYIPFLKRAVAFYVGDKLLLNSESYDDKGRLQWDGWRPFLVPMPRDQAGSFLFIVLTSDESIIGVRQPVILGSRHKIAEQEFWQRGISRIAFFMVYSFMALASFFLWLMNRSVRLYLWLSLCVGTIGIYILSRSMLLKYHFPDDVTLFGYTELVTIYLAPIPLNIFLIELSRSRWMRSLHLFNSIYLLTCIVCLFDPISHVATISAALPYMQLTIGTNIIVFFLLSALLFRSAATNFRIVFYGQVIFLVAVAWQMAHSQRFIHITLDNLLSYGVFAFACSLFLAVAHLVKVNHRKVEEYAEALEDKNQRLEEMDRVKDSFLANTSHELRTPLTGILALSENFAKEYPESSPGTQKIMETISRSAGRLANLVNELLDFSKLSHRDLELTLERVHINSLARHCFEILIKVAQDKGIQLNMTVPEEDIYVTADGERLEQIILNLLGNAIKFTHEGRVTIQIEEHEDACSIAIIDTGVGIKHDDLDKVFSSFEQLSVGNARKYGGTGIGLTITKHLVELHRGQLNVSSEFGKGSCFSFTLPMSQASTATQPAPHHVLVKQKETETADMSRDAVVSTELNGACIAVVDDEEINRQVINQILSERGYRVSTFSSGSQLMQLMEGNSPFDLIILDVMMPDQTGYEVCRQIRRLSQDLPVILLTARNQISELEQGFAAGATDFLTKPFSRRELTARIQNHIEISRLHREVLESSEARVILEKDLEAAEALQKTLLMPTIDSSEKNVSFTYSYQPASRVGGDWFDGFYDKDKRRLFLVLGDVTGHGIAASLLTGVTCGCIRSFFSHYAQSSDETTPILLERLTKTLNAIVHQTGFRENRVMTMNLFGLELKTGRLSFVNAGHQPPFLKSHDSTQTINNPGPLLGMSAESDHKALNIRLQADDQILAFTDGLIENSGETGRQLSSRQLRKLIQSSTAVSPEDLLQEIDQGYHDTVGNHPVEDDTTMIAFRWTQSQDNKDVA
ncbi:MAG: SpoIIE family protein phosphatase [Pseudobacteriovorax sp.]|nr:SpoIIE family protein phosphatase [Pseudobacteriovorax sp.]